MGAEPRLDHLKPFGCAAYVWIPEAQRADGKLNARALRGIFLGFEPGTHNARIFDPVGRKHLRSRDVKYQEEVFPARKNASEDLSFLEGQWESHAVKDLQRNEDQHAEQDNDALYPSCKRTTISNSQQPNPNLDSRHPVERWYSTVSTHSVVPNLLPPPPLPPLPPLPHLPQYLLLLQPPSARRHATIRRGLFYFGSSRVSWKSKRRSIVALSTTEAEYIAAVSAGQEAIHLRQLLQELRYTQTPPTTLAIDNQSTIRVATNPEHQSRIKHIHSIALVEARCTAQDTDWVYIVALPEITQQTY